MARLDEIAKVIRSKNAGPFCLTLDILFGDVDSYQRVVDANIITRERMSELYRQPLSEVQVFHHKQALAMKISLVRKVTAGSIRDTDLYGAQHHVLLYPLQVA
jgi:hypothetical protein